MHCEPGGVALFAPDYLRENFKSTTDHGGADGESRGLRYLEWVSDPDPSDNTYVVDYAYLLREADGTVRAEHDRHVEGLFTRADWLRLLSETGFQARSVPFEHSELEPGSHEVFVAKRPRWSQVVKRGALARSLATAASVFARGRRHSLRASRRCSPPGGTV